jgi:DNA-binding transcriptional LysR family regulator
MPLRLTLRQLEYLVAVGEAGSIAIAAGRLNVSSPSISAAIAQVEADLGLPLFVRRHAHGLSPTQGGLLVIERARKVLAEAASIAELAHGITGQVRGPLTVGCLLTFAQIVLPRLRRDFAAAFPDVEFRQAELTQAEIFGGLRKASLDLALTYDLAIPPDFRFIPLATLPPYAVLPGDHPLAGRPALTLAELAPSPMVLLDLPHSVDYFLALCAAAGVQPRIAERTRDIAVMQSLVANGFGWSIMNVRPLADRAPDGGALAFVPLAGEVRQMRLGLVLAEGAEASMTIRAFVAHCRAADLGLRR